MWRGPTYGAASFRDKETIRKRCWLRVRMTHGRSISGLRNVRFWPESGPSVDTAAIDSHRGIDGGIGGEVVSYSRLGTNS